MNYRKATLDDIENLCDLFDQYRVFYRKESDLKGAKQFLTDRISNMESEIFIAEDSANRLLGFVQLYPIFSSTQMKRVWLLNDLFVSPKSRGKGISVELINKAKELVRQTKAAGMFLETEKSNRIGNKLYPKTGFKLNEASNYYEWNVR